MSEAVHPGKLLRESVEEALSAAGSQVRQRAVNVLVEKELERRTKLLLDGLAKCDEAKRNFNKIKPDVITYNEKGEKQTESWSKPKVEERKKAEQLLKKFDEAIVEALGDKPNYEKLSKVVSGGGDDKEEKKEE